MEQSSFVREVFSWLKTIFLALVIVLVCQTFVFEPVTVNGESMEPTFDQNDRLIISKTSTIDRFDMIVFDAPDVAPDPEEKYVKRVIGLPGDKVEMKDDVLYVNGKAYDEPYVQNNKVELGFEKVNYDFTLEELTGRTTVPENSYFVMGDNRLKSYDSREFGFIHKDDILGEVKFQILPLKEIGLVRSNM